MPERKYPVGAELLSDGSLDVRVWAPASRQCALELVRDAAKPDAIERVPLAAESGGYFSARVAGVRAGARYWLALDHGVFPDPVSRFQPEGPHGPSEVVDPAFAWTDSDWRGRPTRELVIYELHVGTFTPEGTWRAAQVELPELARLGVTMLEVMPIAEFPGEFGWGYDGVDLFAPTRLYGRPEDVRAFINRAHELGIAVVLDVVYNHVGPDGNYLKAFAPEYFSARYANEWGEPPNFDGEHALPVREFFVSNARYWIEEFHFDGLRLDATQQIFDASETHILAEITTAVRAAAPQRQVHLIAENECQHAQLVRPPEAGGYGLDLMWNDDFHHSAMVSATGRAEAYYQEYRGAPQEFVASAKHGFLFQGQWYSWQKGRRGRPALDLKPTQLVNFLQNHDQVANSLHGLRLHQLTGPGKLRALTALLLLGPQIPLLFQGQEFAASARFLYFADHRPELAEQVARGRRRFLSQFPSIAAPESEGVLANPAARATFAQSKLDLSERQKNAPIYRLHADLTRLRRDDPTLGGYQRIDGAVLGEQAFVLRYFGAGGDDRLLIVNLGALLRFGPAPEPLLAPTARGGWKTRWSSDAPIYGGGGTPPLETKANWIIPGETTVLLEPDDNHELPDAKLSEKN